jgi:hypothetical protein
MTIKISWGTFRLSFVLALCAYLILYSVLGNLEGLWLSIIFGYCASYLFLLRFSNFRSESWFVLGFLLVAVGMRLALNYTWVDRSPYIPIAGGVVFAPAKSTFAAPPSWIYGYDDQIGPTLSLAVRLLHPADFVVYVANIKPNTCQVSDGGSLASVPAKEFRERYYTPTYWQDRDFYRLEIHGVTITKYLLVGCSLSDAPAMLSSVRRSVTFAYPNVKPDFIAWDFPRAYARIPVGRIDFQIEGEPDLQVDGVRLYSDPLATAAEQYDLSDKRPIVHATWTDERSQGWRDLILLLAAAMLSLGAALLSDLLRQIIEPFVISNIPRDA